MNHLPFQSTARFRHHTGFVGTVVPSTRTDDDGFFDCELVFTNGDRIGAKWYDLEPTTASVAAGITTSTSRAAITVR